MQLWGLVASDVNTDGANAIPITASEVPPTKPILCLQVVFNAIEQTYQVMTGNLAAIDGNRRNAPWHS
jgi:hypothetical protein